MTFHYIVHYLRYLFFSRHWRGYGVHSPFAFDLVTNVIREELPYYKYSLVEKVRSIYRTSKKTLPLSVGEVSVPKYCGKRAISPSMGQLLFRLVNKYKPETVLESRMGLGISTMYLAAPDSRLKVTTLEQEPELVNYASHYFKTAGFQNIQIHSTSSEAYIASALRNEEHLDFLLLDGCDTGEEIDRWVEVCMPKLYGKSIVVVDGIYENGSKTAAWKRLQSNYKVHVTVDLFHLGIAFFDEKLKKENYFVRYFPVFHL